MTPDLPRLIEYEPLARHTAWNIGGPARYYMEADTPAALQAALIWGQARKIPLLLLGSGTKMLIRDSGFPGLVLRYTARHWHIDETSGRLRVASGAPMAGTARRVSHQGWAGLEWAEGLPGTIGGAIYGNAGCYGGDIASVLARAWLFIDGAPCEWPVAQWQYNYRNSRLKAEEHQDSYSLPPVILAAEFRLQQADPAQLAETMARTAAARKSKTPWGRSCGSVFKNPPDHAAGQLLEMAGLKGQRIGGAEISSQHANYIVNVGGATSDDVMRLITLAHDIVLQQSGIDLELEVQLV